ncbi:DUF1572 domain-containing protein [Paracrocinitomix mangrovi]|uniref:DUF1572 family protein n=1 Tax=Paracrocinitomix mangrovi TaxID=2862509 RepID=UPI001C8D72B5|nr:DUF1572 family protein [Paracrocinitomix mangrovi]UKN03525.1 DUF1572 domain-containing protein [Paracrocinitomix mangrovi]
MIPNYLNSVIKQFEYYKSLGDKTFAQLDENDIHWTADPNTNSIAIIVNHLWGNMMSRWTNFLTTDGEKEWRQRDLEFEKVIKTKADLIDKWEEGWRCLFGALYSITPDNFDRPIYIRKQKHTMIEAFNRQLCHYAYHVGQIVLIGTQVKGNNWQSLSIPKGGSKAFNEEKMSRGKLDGHFTDDIK